MLNVAALITLRQQSLQWAVATASAGESGASVLSRADDYLRWLTVPVRDDVVQAMGERVGQPIQ